MPVRDRRSLAASLIILLLAAGLRFHALTRDTRFHPDEALFSAFARAAALNGEWLLPGPLDKPPLALYAIALSMLPFVDWRDPNLLQLDIHDGEFAARLPGLAASVLLVAVVGALARALYRGPSREVVALAAMLLVALSPFAVAFSATAFTDGLMLLFVTAALWAVALGRWQVAGWCVAAGLACKQQALFYLPLVLALGWMLDSSDRHRRPIRGALRVLLPIGLVALLLFVWDGARAQPTGFWALAAANNDPGRFARLDEIAPRLQVWLRYAGVLLGPPVITAGLVVLASVAFLRLLRVPPRRDVRVDACLLGFAFAYTLLHVVVAFSLHDRYLLLLLPVAALLSARGIVVLLDSTLARRPPVRVLARGAAVLGVAALALSGWDAANGRVSVGGDRGEHDGIDALAEYLNSRTLGAIIYDRWLGWELSYYLGFWTDKRRVYYPTPDALVADALLQPDPAPRYFVAPVSAPSAPWLSALRDAGFAPHRVYASPNFVVFQLTPPWAAASD